MRGFAGILGGLAVVLAVGWFAGRDPLVRFALEWASDLQRLERVEGALFGTLRLRGVAFSVAGTHVEAELLAASLDWPELLGGRLRVRELIFESGAISFDPGASGGAAEPASIALPELPDVAIRSLHVRDATLRTAADSWVIQRADGGIVMDRHGLRLRHLSVLAVGIELWAEGHIGSGPGGMLDLSAGVDGSVNGSVIALRATAGGTTDRVALGIASSAPVVARLDALVSVDPGLRLRTVDARASVRTEVGEVAAERLDFDWRSDFLELSGRLAVTHPEGPVDQAPVRLEVQGALADQRELVAAVRTATPGGALELAVEGDLSSQRLDTRLALRDWQPLAGLSAFAAWLGPVDAPPLAELSLAGTLAVGVTDFAAPVLRLATSDLEVRAPTVDARLNVDATFANGEPSGRATLRAGEQRLSAVLDSGVLSVAASAERLGALLPGLSGALDADARIALRADRAWPEQIDVSVSANDLAFGGLRVERATLDGMLGAGSDGTLLLSMSDATLPGWPRTASARIRANGALQSPEWQLDFSDSHVEAHASGRMVGRGSLPVELDLEAVEVAAPGWGTWRSSTGTRLVLAEQVALSRPFCAADDAGAEICVRVDDGRWTLTLADVAAANVARLLQTEVPNWPPSIDLAGRLDAEAGAGPFDSSGSVPVDLRVAWRDGSITPDTAAEMLEPVLLSSATVELSGGVRMAELLVHGTAHAEVIVEDGSRISLALERSQQGALAGSLAARIADLSPLGALAPEIGAIDGAARIDLALSGTDVAPRLDGKMNLDGTLLAAANGVAWREIEIAFADTGESVAPLRITGSAAAGAGRLSLAGRAGWRAESGWVADLSLDAQSIPFIDLQDLSASGDASLQVSLGDAVRIAGTTQVRHARINLAAAPVTNGVTLSNDVVIVDAPDAPDAPDAAVPVTLPLWLDLRLALGDDVQVSAAGLASAVGGSVRLQQQPGRPPRMTGALAAVSGSYRFYGVDLELERGRLDFDGAADNPAVSLRVRRELDGQTVGLDVGGRLQRLETKLTSNPPLRDDVALQWLITGRAPGSGGDTNPFERDRVADAALSLGIGATGAVGRLRKTLQLDELEVRGSLSTGTVLMGRRINDRLYLTYEFGLLNRSSGAALRYRLTDSLSLQSEVGAARGVELMYDRRFDRLGFGDGAGVEVTGERAD